MLAKYDVYENDLKFSEHIDPEKTRWHNKDVQKKFLTNEVKTLEYRLNECRKNNYEYLDISYLKLESIPDFTKHVDYNKLQNIKFLFANDNEIKDLEKSLFQFKKLQVLDISCNKLKKIKTIPSSLTELVCHNNKLTLICSSDYLLTLDCSFNRMESISEYSSAKTILCENNKICEFQTFLNAKHISLKDNPLTKIHSQPNLEFLNIENTSLTGDLPEMPRLKWLICHNTSIGGIKKLISLEHIEMTKCSLLEIPYLKFLQDILCDLSSNLKVDNKMKLKTYLIEREHAYYIFNIN
jgi:Leucine-rich repeat (LRR) protein